MSSRRRVLLIVASVATAAGAACSNTVVEGQSTGVGDTEAAATSTHAAGAGGSAHGSGGRDASGGGGGSTPHTCGRVDCAADEYCAHTDHLCGKQGGARGVCTKRPVCPDGGTDVACGCDGQHYVSACGAAELGVDTAFAKECEASEGTLPCDLGYCNLTTEYCLTGVTGVTSVGEGGCRPLLPTCTTRRCAPAFNGLDPCVDTTLCLGNVRECMQAADGSLTLYCGEMR